jgi:hypothetical protein
VYENSSVGIIQPRAHDDEITVATPLVLDPGSNLKTEAMSQLLSVNGSISIYLMCRVASVIQVAAFSV